MTRMQNLRVPQAPSDSDWESMLKVSRWAPKWVQKHTPARHAPGACAPAPVAALIGPVPGPLDRAAFGPRAQAAWHLGRRRTRDVRARRKKTAVAPSFCFSGGPDPLPRPEWAKCKRRRRSGSRAPCSVRSSRSGPMPDSMRPAMVVAPQLPHAAAAAGHDAAPRLTPRGASTASFQHFKAISLSDRYACAQPGQFVHPNQPLRGVYMNISLAFSQNVRCNHFETGPVSKLRSKISRVVRTERPAPTQTCCVYSLEPALCPSRRSPPLGRSFVKSCADFILAGGGVPNKVLYGGDVDAFAISSNP